MSYTKFRRICKTVLTSVRAPKKFRDAVPAPLGWGRADPRRNMLKFFLTCRADFDHSRSNHSHIIIEIPKNVTRGVPPFNFTETHRNRHGYRLATYDILLVFHSKWPYMHRRRSKGQRGQLPPLGDRGGGANVTVTNAPFPIS